MRIAQVVTYVSADGAFGGPVAVAVAQCAELAARGHQVTLFAAWDGEAEVDAPGVDLRLFRVRRLRRQPLTTLLSIRLLSELRRSAEHFDVVHHHFGRDLLSLGAWLVLARRRRRAVLQTHGMVVGGRRAVVRLIDAVVVRRALESAAAVLVLTEAERAALEDVAQHGLERAELVRNGVPAVPDATTARDEGANVLFLARLHPRKGVLVLAEAVRLLLEQGVDVHLEVLGPDEGDLAALERFIVSHSLHDRILYRGAASSGDALAALRRASVYVLPSRREVYPMTVLEAMSVGTPVIVTEDCGLAPLLRASGAAEVVVASPEAVAAALGGLLNEERRRVELAARGLRAAQEEFGISAVAARLQLLYERAAARG